MPFETYPNLKGTIFIVTYGRSGSTLLQSLLQSIPGAHIVGENYNALEGLFRTAERARMARSKWGKKDHPPNHPWHNASRIRPVRLETGLAEVFTRELIAPPRDARWIGFKEIRFQTLDDDFEGFLNFQRRAFPNAFFVFNSRRGEDVANSAFWKKRPRDQVLDMVTRMDARFADFADKNPDCSHHVFYEQTIDDPATLQPLFDKLDEPLDLDAAKAVLGERLTH
ncbi:MAG: sulfotransferase [Rhodobacteraceae bacterium]|nr:sulfotransferase [Paracoccaceae bacterium]